MTRTKTITLTVGSLAAGALLATSVTGLALAADAAPSPSSSSSTPSLDTIPPDATGQSGPAHRGGHGGPGDGMRGGPHGGMLGGPRGDALHGETVVKAADGTISTVRMVSGTVTAVSAGSITVKAEDGYSGTFTISATTEVHTGLPARPAEGTAPTAPVAGSISDVEVGDVARVEGTVEGSAASAVEVHSMTADQAAQLEKDRAAMDAQRQAHDDSTGATSGGATSGSASSSMLAG